MEQVGLLIVCPNSKEPEHPVKLVIVKDAGIDKLIVWPDWVQDKPDPQANSTAPLMPFTEDTPEDELPPPTVKSYGPNVP